MSQINQKTKEIQERLFSMQDTAFADFQRKLIPNIDPAVIIGVRTPQLRKLGKELAKDAQIREFLSDLPHRYFEEMCIHGFVMEQCKDYDKLIADLDKWLPYVDNWAVCDLVSPKIFGKRQPELPGQIVAWMASEHPYTVRFGIGMLMRWYLDDGFLPEYLEMVARIRSEEYYVNMMIAWYFATALAKQYDAVLPYLEQKKLAPWTHNKAIQKAVESYRITGEQKEYLKSLKVKITKKATPQDL